MDYRAKPVKPVSGRVFSYKLARSLAAKVFSFCAIRAQLAEVKNSELVFFFRSFPDFGAKIQNDGEEIKSNVEKFLETSRSKKIDLQLLFFEPSPSLKF